jgi:TonB family protein
MSRVGMLVVLVACYAISAFAQDTAPAGEAPPNHEQQASSRVRVPSEYMLGLVDRKTMPVYPEAAMKKGIQGDVIFKIEVDETGKITDSVPVKGDPLLIDAGKEALKTFHFRPYQADGVPVKVRSKLGFHFSTEKSGDAVSGHVECMASLPAQP